MRARQRGTLAVRFACAVALLSLAACRALRGDAVPEPAGYWSGPMNGPVPASLAGGKVIGARELATLLTADPAPVVIDSSNAQARPAGMASDAPWLPLPHEGIPGSLWIPGIGHAGIREATDDYFRERLAGSSGGDRDHPIVLYCHERCWLSWNAARRAIGYGYRHVYWFTEGIEGWRAAGLDTGIIEPEGPEAP
jgi:PQQ-dependent catabolism-associated CXXCW motif protein